MQNEFKCLLKRHKEYEKIKTAAIQKKIQGV